MFSGSSYKVLFEHMYVLDQIPISACNGKMIVKVERCLFTSTNFISEFFPRMNNCIKFHRPKIDVEF